MQNSIEQKFVKPLPKKIFDKDEGAEALRYMSTGKHTGKILLKFKDEFDDSLVTLKAKPRFFCDPKKIYVLVGGLGGFGVELSDWLVGRGAKKLVLVTTNDITTGYQRVKLRDWMKKDCKVIVSQDNLTSEEGCVKLLTKANSLGTFDGIFNLAAVLHDALIENQTEQTFKTVFMPKAFTTTNLNAISRKACPNLRYFVVFSSYSSGRGMAGQTNYGMGNSVMERICEKRKTDGYPALAIQWGLIGDVGMIIEKLSDKVHDDHLMKQEISSCLEIMDTFLTQEEVVVSSMTINDKEHNHKSKSQEIMDTIANILAITNLVHVSIHSSLSSLGLNSTSTIQLRNFLNSECGLSFSPRELRNMTLNTLKQLINL